MTSIVIGKKFVRLFSDYCLQSGMRCFSFVKNAIHSVEAALWLLLIAAFICVTVSNVVETATRFVEKPTVTKVFVESQIRFKLTNDPTLCLTNQISSFQKKYPQNASEFDTTIGSILGSARASNVSVEAFLSGVLARTYLEATRALQRVLENGNFSTSEQLIRSLLASTNEQNRDGMPESVQQFFAVTANLLELLTGAENSHEFKAVNVTQFLDENPSPIRPYGFSPDDWEILETNFDHVIKHGISPSKLMGLAGSYACLLRKVTVVNVREAPRASRVGARGPGAGSSLLANAKTPCEPETILWFGVGHKEETLVCVPLARELFEYELGDGVASTFITLSPLGVFEQEMLDWLVDNYARRNKSEKFFRRLSTVWLDFSGQRFQSPTAPSPLVKISLSSADAVEVNLNVIGRFKMKNLDRSPCSESQSPVDCRGFCRSKFVLERCECWPFSWSKLEQRVDYPTTVPHCLTNKTLHMNCLWSTKTFKKMDEECTAKCHRPCDFMLVETLKANIDFFSADGESGGSKKSRSANPLNENSPLIIRIRTDSFVYPTYVEVLEMDGRALISQLGGCLSLWVGGSFMALIHIFVFLARIPFVKLEENSV